MVLGPTLIQLGGFTLAQREAEVFFETMSDPSDTDSSAGKRKSKVVKLARIQRSRRVVLQRILSRDVKRRPGPEMSPRSVGVYLPSYTFRVDS